MQHKECKFCTFKVYINHYSKAIARKSILSHVYGDLCFTVRRSEEVKNSVVLALSVVYVGELNIFNV